MRTIHTATASLLGVLFAALLVVPVQAQTSLSLEGRLGMGVPTGELDEFVDPGLSYGGALGYEVAGPLEVVLEAERQSWDADSGDADATRALGGLRLNLPTLVLPFSLSAEAVAGRTFYDVDAAGRLANAPPHRIELLDDSFTVGAGVAAGFDPLPIVDLLLRVDYRWVAAEAEPETGQNGETTDGFDGLASFPVRAAVRISL